MAVLDAVLNNSDRKGGHLLPRPDGRVQGVDHGLCFSAEDKLRTVLWQWRGRRLTEEAVAVLTALRTDLDGRLAAELAALLTVSEVRRTIERVDELLARRRHPQPSPDWPAVPWPPF